MAYSFKFQISGLEENGGHLNMGCAYGSTNFTYGYLNDTPGNILHRIYGTEQHVYAWLLCLPLGKANHIQLKIAQMSLGDLTSIGY